MNWKETLRFVARWCVLLLRPFILYEYIRAGWMLRHQMLREKTADIYTRNLEVSEKFREGIRLLRESAEQGKDCDLPVSQTAKEVATTLLEQGPAPLTEQEAKTLAEYQLGRMYWLHPARLYNQLIQYNPQDPRIKHTDPHNPVGVARAIHSLRRESSYDHESDHSG